MDEPPAKDPVARPEPDAELPIGGDAVGADGVGGDSGRGDAADGDAPARGTVPTRVEKPAEGGALGAVGDSDTLAAVGDSDTLAAVGDSDTLAAAGDRDALAAAGESDTLAAAQPIARSGQAGRVGRLQTGPGTPIEPVGQLRPDNTGETDRWVGRTLADRYTLTERLGRGGMAVVYLARHEMLKKMVAVKVLRDDVTINKSALDRFHREAMAAASIGDPHIVDVTDYGFTDDGNAFIVMERLEGVDLRGLLRAEGALQPGRAVAIARQILRGLTAAHRRGIVHRDLKAENVFLCRRDEGEFVKLLDFGISKIAWPIDDSSGEVLTSTGMVMGTPQYIAPEQAHGEKNLDHRVDIYSLGVILYEMLTGSLPFSGKSALDVLMKHVQDTPQPPRQRRSDLDIPAALERVVLKAMSKQREQRYLSAEEMLAALPPAQSLPGGHASRALPIAPRPLRPWGVMLVLAVVAVFGLGALLVFWSFPALEGGAMPDASALSLVGVVPDAAQRSAGRDLPRRLVAPSESDADAEPLSPPRVILDVQVEPKQARIFVDGAAFGQGATRKRVSRGGRPLSIVVRARGYVTRRLRIVPDRDRAIALSLQRRSRGKKGPKGKQQPVDLRDNPYVKKPEP